MAVTAHLVGDMPEQDSRVIAEPLCQLLVDDADFFPVDRRCIAVILPPVVQLPDPVCPDSAHLGVFVCHPSRAGRTGRCKDRIDSIGIQVMDDVSQPIQLKYPLCGSNVDHENTPSVTVLTWCLFHQFDVLRQNIGPVQPLFRVVVSAMK